MKQPDLLQSDSDRETPVPTSLNSPSTAKQTTTGAIALLSPKEEIKPISSPTSPKEIDASNARAKAKDAQSPTPISPKQNDPLLLLSQKLSKLPDFSAASFKQQKLKDVAKALVLVRKMKARARAKKAGFRGKRMSLHEGPPKHFGAKIRYYLGRIYKALGLGHLFLLIIVVAYAFLGGAIFSAIEQPHELRQKQLQHNRTMAEARNLTDAIFAIQEDRNLTEFLKQESVFQLLRAYQNSSRLLPAKNVTWDLWGAVFYSGTIFTTIGYGHFTCQTIAGRAATMAYAVVGIPLLLATLQDLGKFLTRLLKRLWNNFCFCCSYQTSKEASRNRKKSKPFTVRAGLRLKLWLLTTFRRCCRRPDSRRTQKQRCENDDTDEESEVSAELEEFDFPISIAIVLLIGWILISAGIFCIWETQWTYFDAVYFFFVSLTTIGLGDILPNHPKYMMLVFWLVICGLSLVTMVITLIQGWLERVKHKTQDYIEDELGWSTDTSEEEEERAKLQAKMICDPNQPHAVDTQASTDYESELDASDWEEELRAQDAALVVQTGDNFRATLGIFGGGATAAPRKRQPKRIRRGVQTDEVQIVDSNIAKTDDAKKKIHENT